MAKSTADLITIVRNVTGRVDSSDPQFTDAIILGYINDFYTLLMTQEVRLNEQRTWWEFDIDTTTLDPMPVDLQNPLNAPAGVQFSTIGPLIYVEGFQAWWYEDPQQFYWRWPETQTYTPARPTEILYYNNTLTFRNPPDQQYSVKISAYMAPVEMVGGQNISEDYLFRYVCYGAARDIFSDFGELDQWQNYMPVFERYKSLVYARTYQQNMNKRSLPRF